MAISVDARVFSKGKKDGIQNGTTQWALYSDMGSLH